MNRTPTASIAFLVAMATVYLSSEPGHAQEATATLAPVTERAEPESQNLLVALAFRPEPRLEAVWTHALFGFGRWVHVLSAGFGTFGDTELRTGMLLPSLAPAYPWLAYRIRPIELAELPPVEHYASAGIGFSSPTTSRVAWDAGLGVQFQLPPLAPEPAADPVTYFAENVQIVLYFALRIRVL